MTVHVLDTGAVLHLHDRHNPPLLRELRAAGKDAAIWIPSLVLTEANQAKPLFKKRRETIFEIADVADIDERVADRAAEGLRAVKRDRCVKCSNFIRSSIVDAIVMAFADQYAQPGDEVIVYTSDMTDMELLRDAAFTSVTLSRC